MRDDPLPRVAHRPWPLPRGPWIGAQRWHDLLFAHWSVPVEVLRPLIPRPLELETFDGRAWVGVVPFRMTGVRLRCCPPAPGLSRLPELNVRTYVRRRGVADPKPGVYFFSLDIFSRLATWTARALYKLPYFHADMACAASADGWIEYASRRRAAPRARPATFAGRYRPTGDVCPAQPGSLEHWLTERYCLHTTDKLGRGYTCDIHHRPWPLQPAEAEIAENSMAAAAGIWLPGLPATLHFARFIDVRVWPLRRFA